MPTERTKVLLATPSWGTAPPEACEYRNHLAFRAGMWEAQPDCPFRFSLGVVPDMLVQFTREEICRRAVEEGFSHVCMIDDDMTGPGDLWERLLMLDVDVVAPLAFTRAAPHVPVCYAVRGGWVPGAQNHQSVHHVIRNYPKNALFECDSVGFGAVCIKTDVLKAVPRPWFFNMTGTQGTGEDIWFCIQAKRAGFRVFCDSRVPLGHLGPRTYIGEADYERCNPEVSAMREHLGDWSLDKAKANLTA